MIVTAFSGGLGNIIVKTKDPLKGWGSPIKLDFSGIDPCIFFDDRKVLYIMMLRIKRKNYTMITV